MVRNAAHDSVSACSVDEVVEAVMVRYSEAYRIADGLADGALVALTRSLSEPGPSVANVAARTRGGTVEFVVQGAEIPEGGQALPEEPGAFGIPRGLGPLTLDAATVRTILGMLPNGSQIDTETWIQDVHVEEDDSGIDITIAFGSEERFDVPIASIKQDLYTRLGARPDSVVRILIDQPPVRRVLARVADVPGFGWKVLEPVAPSHPISVEDAADTVVMQNGLVTVAVSRDDGTFSVDGHAGFGRLVDGGDHGDSYNYSPPPGDRLVDTPDTVSVQLTESGPVRAVITVSARYTWPDHVDGVTRARTGEVIADVATEIELRADERIVRVTTRFVNPASDHRLRVHMPLPAPAEGSDAECAFAVVHRGLDTEGRPDELGLPTFPSRRFVSAGGLTVAHEGLLEYELVDIEGEQSARRARTMALTLLRSTGMLSRLGMAYRPLPAGPIVPVEGLQLRGRAIEARVCAVHWLRRPLRHGGRRLLAPRGRLRRRGRLAAAVGERPRGGGRRGLSGPPPGRDARGAGVQPDRPPRHRRGGRTLGLARRPARQDSRARRRLIRAPTVRDRHVPLSRLRAPRQRDHHRYRRRVHHRRHSPLHRRHVPR